MTIQEKIDQAVAQIRETLGQAQRPALLLSGGKESVLLLHLLTHVVEQKIECIFWHDDVKGQEGRTKFVEDLTLAEDLTVVTWPPMWRGFAVTPIVGVEIFSGHDLSGVLISSVVEVVDGEYPEVPCIHKWVNEGQTSTFPICPFDLLFHGGRMEDVHPVLGPSVLDREVTVQHLKVVYPLHDWNVIDVWEAIEALGASYDIERYDGGGDGEHADRVRMCARCVDTSKTGQAWCGVLGRQIPYGGYVEVDQEC
jgi:hypothetical protein